MVVGESHWNRDAALLRSGLLTRSNALIRYAKLIFCMSFVCITCARVRAPSAMASSVGRSIDKIGQVNSKSVEPNGSMALLSSWCGTWLTEGFGWVWQFTS